LVVGSVGVTAHLTPWWDQFRESWGGFQYLKLFRSFVSTFHVGGGEACK
jgi:hypothetical protein